MENTKQQLLDFRKLLITQKDIAKPIFEKYGTDNEVIKNSIVNIKELFANRLSLFQPEIMFYGIYNAGKSSLLNALMGKICAKVADIPTTDSIDSYQWNGYKLTDTPGVNAPIEHQRVTEEHLRKSDVVIFVMSTNGSFEDVYNYKQMTQIINSGKQLIIVLNDKVGYVSGKPEHDKIISNIKMKIAQNMLQIGAADSIEQIENKYQVILVHAERALRGRLEGSSQWVDISNILELEKAIYRELKRADGFKVLVTVLDYFEIELQQLRDCVMSKEQEIDTKELAKLLLTVREQKNYIRNSMTAIVSGMSSGLESQLTQGMWNNRQNQKQMEEKVNNIVVDFVKKVQDKLMLELERSQDVLQVKLSETMKSLTDIQETMQQSIKMPENKYTEQSNSEIVDNGISGAGIIEHNGLQKTLSSLQKISELLKVTGPIIIKDGPMPLPIGNMGKIATETVAQKAMELAAKAGYKELAKVIGVSIPYIGPIIFGVSILYDIFSSNNDNEKAEHERKCAKAEAANEQERRRIEMELQARQELRQNCSAMVYDLTEAMTQAINNQIEGTFNSLEDSLENALQQANSKSAILASDVKCINAVSDECRTLKVKISR